VLRELWLSGQAVPLVSRPTTEELLTVLAYPKFKLSDTDREDLLAEFLPFAEIVTIPDPPPKVPACRDPHDMPFLELAVVAKADALVTGDLDLQALRGRFSDRHPDAGAMARRFACSINSFYNNDLHAAAFEWTHRMRRRFGAVFSLAERPPAVLFRGSE